MLDNYQNYYYYGDLIKNKSFIINTSSINIQNWYYHYTGILNILKDGIETDYLQHLFITVHFDIEDEYVDLSINDYFINLLLWRCIIALNDDKIHVYHLYFKDKFTAANIKKYIDNFFVIPYKQKVSNKVLNNVIADCIERFIDLDIFSLYMANTLNLEDSIDLAQKSPEYDALLHSDLSQEPLETVEQKAMQLVKQAQQFIYNSENIVGHEHCLRNAFISGEGIRIKQYKENSIMIGAKPNNKGSVYPEIINSSYINGGLNKLLYQFIDSSAARVSQIVNKVSIGDSGGFARIVSLNNCEAFINPDLEFDCGTQNYLKLFITNKDIFNLLYNRYYKLHPEGQLLKINQGDTYLIGKTIYLRSPIFCASHAAGSGYCKYCYGDLAHTNININPGRLAGEMITEQIQQQKLSSKHIMAAKIKPILWSDALDRFFKVNVNAIVLRPDIDPTTLKDWYLELDLNDIQLENNDDIYRYDFNENNMITIEDEDNTHKYNEFLYNFKIIDPNQNEYEVKGIVKDEIQGDNLIRLYITNVFGQLIRRFVSIDDDKIQIPLNEIIDTEILIIKLENDDIGKVLEVLEGLIDKKNITKNLTIEEMIPKLLLASIKGGIHATSVHFEVLVSNQIRSVHDILLKPNWLNKNEPYQLLTLNESLKNNPSIIISLTYEDFKETIKQPLSLKKYKSSIFDLFYHRQPKKFVNTNKEIIEVPNQPGIKPGESPIMFVQKNNPDLFYSLTRDGKPKE